MLARLGCALILIGSLLLLVFLVTCRGQQADPSTFMVGIALFVLGCLLRRRRKHEAEPGSARFHTVRRLLGRNDGEEEEG